MVRRIVSSRERFREYLDRLRRRRISPDEAPQPGERPDRRRRRRVRSSRELVARFFGLLRGQRLAVAFSLFTLSISTLLALVPPAATKFIVDYVLGNKPLPSTIPAWLHLPTD